MRTVYTAHVSINKANRMKTAVGTKHISSNVSRIELFFKFSIQYILIIFILPQPFLDPSPVPTVKSVLYWPTGHEHEGCPGVWLIYSVLLHNENWFSLSWKLSVAKSFLVRDKIWFLFPLFCSGILSGVHMCISPVVSVKCYFLGVIHHLCILFSIVG